ncbi:hypothetical protein ASD54_11025 [Rhizobium sp. Root149]|uniref:hypothetical protein n=1 Tax=Rhizobium sp. Root149 TaxID=1736473 RepID=UPI0007138705|nr:hypothetical protein [Rhizobium sp. Root149]KQZ50732.1 hypothetical protein ASD54_11025 [Rhizobium sp. Root149]
MTVFSTAGSKLFIGGSIDQKTGDFVANDFTSQVWTEITPIESLGTIGDSAQAITMSVIGNSRLLKAKGTKDAGDMQIVAGVDYADAGQIALLAAAKSQHNFAFKIQFNDAPEGADSTPSSRMFIALVMSANEELAAADNFMKLNATLAINSNIVRVNAAA